MVLASDGARFFGVVHLSGIGTGKHVGTCALAELRGELAGGAEIEDQSGIGIGLLKRRAHVLKCIGQRRGGEDHDLTRDRCRRSRLGRRGRLSGWRHDRLGSGDGCRRSARGWRVWAAGNQADERAADRQQTPHRCRHADRAGAGLIRRRHTAQCTRDMQQLATKKPDRQTHECTLHECTSDPVREG